MTQYEYKSVVVGEGLISQGVSRGKIENAANKLGKDGWLLRTTVTERKRFLFFFSRETLILIFAREK